MKYLDSEDILIIHARIIDKTGGSHGIRDIGLLISLGARPKTKFSGKELYKSVLQKAAVYLESLVSYHVFVDGNKRTGIATAARFLFLNGFELVASNRELEKFVLKIATKKLDVDSIAKWIKKHSRRMKK